MLAKHGLPLMWRTPWTEGHMTTSDGTIDKTRNNSRNIGPSHRVFRISKTAALDCGGGKGILLVETEKEM